MPDEIVGEVIETGVAVVECMPEIIEAGACVAVAVLDALFDW
jgi:orotate phosphoribosyltransferase